jgi:glutamate dehydrogenase (NAD(P)+)
VARKNKICTVMGFPSTKAISNEELLELDVTVPIPAALENVITEANAGRIKTKIIVELANGPTTPRPTRFCTRTASMGSPTSWPMRVA